MRKVLFKKFEREVGLSDFTHEGVFHQWASGYEEFESGPGNYTYGIVELPDGTIEDVPPTHIKFLD